MVDGPGPPLGHVVIRIIVSPVLVPLLQHTHHDYTQTDKASKRTRGEGLNIDGLCNRRDDGSSWGTFSIPEYVVKVMFAGGPVSSTHPPVRVSMGWKGRTSK